MGENLEKITESISDIAENGVPIAVKIDPLSILLLGITLVIALCTPVLLWRSFQNK